MSKIWVTEGKLMEVVGAQTQGYRLGQYLEIFIYASLTCICKHSAGT